MPSLEFVAQFLNEHCENVSEKRGKFQARCPICGDSQKSRRKRRFHLTFFADDNIIWHCYNCDAAGSFTNLYATLKDMTFEDAYKDINGFDSVVKHLQAPKLKKLKPEDVARIGTTTYDNLLEKDCVNENGIYSGYIESSCLKYLKFFRTSRGVPKNVKLYFCYNGKYKNRIIIPIYENGKVVYFQARAASKNQEPKYLNPPMTREVVIPNKDTLQNDIPVIITEGLLDCYSVSNGTACLGKSITDTFLKELMKINSDIIIVFDNDEAGRQARDKFFNESGLYRKVKYFIWSEKLPKAKDLNQLMVENKLSIKEMDEIVKANSYDYDDFYVRINLC